jgi:hypothetical protein
MNGQRAAGGKRGTAGITHIRFLTRVCALVGIQVAGDVGGVLTLVATESASALLLQHALVASAATTSRHTTATSITIHIRVDRVLDVNLSVHRDNTVSKDASKREGVMPRCWSISGTNGAGEHMAATKSAYNLRGSIRNRHVRAPGDAAVPAKVHLKLRLKDFFLWRDAWLAMFPGFSG